MRKKRYLYIAVGIAILITIVQLCYKGMSAKSLLEIVFNLNYSFLAAAIFFVLQTVIPDRGRAQKAKLVLQPNINEIVDKLDFLVAFTDCVLSFEGDNIIVHGIDDGIIYFDKEKNEQLIRSFLNYREYLQTCVVAIRKQIAITKENSMYHFLDETLIAIMSEIETDNIMVISSVGQLYPMCTRYQNLQLELKKVKDYYAKLSKYSNCAGRWSVRLLSEEERKEYKERLSQNKVYHDELNNFLTKTAIK